MGCRAPRRSFGCDIRARLGVVLGEHGLGGVLYVGVPANAVDPQTDIVITPIRVQNAEAWESESEFNDMTIEIKGSC